MKKVITYGTFDLLHDGHVFLLKRARALGDYLVVGVTSDAFDQLRGKVNTYQTLCERMESVRSLGIADEVIVEEYEGQKIEDIRRRKIDVFVAGSDWRGRFDYLEEYCKVVYLERTLGISSTMRRSQKLTLRLGFIGEARAVSGYVCESAHVDYLEPVGVLQESDGCELVGAPTFDRLDELLRDCDAVYIASHPSKRYEHAERALDCGAHVLCELPLGVSKTQCARLRELADERGLLLTGAARVAYSLAFHHMVLLVKSGVVGKIRSVCVFCGSSRNLRLGSADASEGSAVFEAWLSMALLAVFQLLGTGYHAVNTVTGASSKDVELVASSKVVLTYSDASAEIAFGKTGCEENSLVALGEKGCVRVPAPWWDADYFEVHNQGSARIRRYSFQNDGGGIRQELVSFARAVECGNEGTLAVSFDCIQSITDVVYNVRNSLESSI